MKVITRLNTPELFFFAFLPQSQILVPYFEQEMQAKVYNEGEGQPNVTAPKLQLITSVEILQWDLNAVGITCF